jgi:hypothetical protein
MEEKYKLQYRNYKEDSFAIRWTHNKKDYVEGDCLVKAIKTDTDVKINKRLRLQENYYTNSMTLDGARNLIVKNKNMLGSQIHDCIGLTLDDICESVEFDEPIQVRNF